MPDNDQLLYTIQSGMGIDMTPKTPKKKIPYKSMQVSSTPLKLMQVSDKSLQKKHSAASMAGAFLIGPKLECSLIGSMDYFEDNFTQMGTIGDGDYGEVIKVERQKNCSDEANKIGDEYTCIKRMKYKYTNETDRLAKLREVEILYLLSGINTVAINMAWEQCGILYIEMEYCNWGNLRDYMNMVYFYKKCKFTNRCIRKIIRDIALGLKELHSKKIVHCDLKPENIFIKGTEDIYNARWITSPDIIETEMNTIEDTNVVIKIGDFNISKFEGSSVNYNLYEGEKRYLAPEVLDGVISTKSDIFSLGLIYLEIVKEIILPNDGLLYQYLRSDIFDPFGLNNKFNYSSLIKKMLNSDYKERIGIDMVLSFLNTK
ncbi:Membrane-associated tyrosine- and threonine-specific cdc2-inhibitory kinase [Astathelohania contejeani]|uniref:Membrane-associated tyrosine- and threonine-specific cdc2-inhibitory kinase n=1 Tax=Astathelohania contejeani TaxID=164912 RepID=A0ABQ7I0C2_9MICR|nr:Membrane-associated tyrosine- and threonine-specific cdc2-inhibitory kinase [Thelohania contejeani]